MVVNIDAVVTLERCPNNASEELLFGDRDLLPLIALGDEHAIEACMARYGGLVWSLALRNCPDRASAEDAVQDIFLRIWQSADQYDSNVASETTFVAVLARRRLIDLFRRRKPLPAIDFGVAEQVPDPTRDAATSAELKEEAIKAEEILSKLPCDQQQVIRLNVYDGLSHSRIASLTGLSLGTVKTHIRRGMIDLRRSLFPPIQILAKKL